MKHVKSGIKLWNKAKRIIPGGTQLLSKRSEMFLPEQWPSYFKKAKGVDVWDLDGNKYTDMTIMGVGACILGYSDLDVNAAVLKVVKDGSMCTLNSPEEVELAENLLRIHPWAGGVRFCRTGGEAMAIAVRIARAYSKRDKVAFCGYHGWHDWYLATNIADPNNLDQHLLEGLQPLGVPKSLANTAIPFQYNQIKQLEEIVEKNDIGVIVVEPLRHQEPQAGFLKNVRKIADDANAVLIFDEITIGFRKNVGGVHLLYNVNPDIAVFAKALGNGFPIGAIIGNSEVMDVAQLTFISSTYWTERIGPAAAVSTIKKMEKYDVPRHLSKIGSEINKGWNDAAKKNDINLEVLKPNALITFKLNYDNGQAIRTLFTQELLKKGYLAGPSVYVSFAHTKKIVNSYLEAVNETFEFISKSINDNNVESKLEGPIAHTGFQRLT
ncbi:MAG: aminotransferase class III-fold pyridoxal phosphate-dependent enzyme [Candidatus Lokiarchaeota archaeon]|nr:aminotransferase class III-fold pyridoxal phosphate-dependent enzyme [Candidatus Lokiarchaeota archaeon]